MDRSNHRLNVEIERFIEQWDGTSIGYDVKNMYENGTRYEYICERMGIDYEDYVERSPECRNSRWDHSNFERDVEWGWDR